MCDPCWAAAAEPVLRRYATLLLLLPSSSLCCCCCCRRWLAVWCLWDAALSATAAAPSALPTDRPGVCSALLLLLLVVRVLVPACCCSCAASATIHGVGGHSLSSQLLGWDPPCFCQMLPAPLLLLLPLLLLVCWHRVVPLLLLLPLLVLSTWCCCCWVLLWCNRLTLAAPAAPVGPSRRCKSYPNT